jgi:hypothetical protein
MIKMKKLIRSLVIASGGLFIAANASDAASISFQPRGEQIDDDDIFDLVKRVGDKETFTFHVDTFLNLDKKLPGKILLVFGITLDPTELKFIEDPLPSLVLTVVIPQDQKGRIEHNVTVEVLKGLNDDGEPDLSLQFISAQLIFLDKDDKGADKLVVLKNLNELFGHKNIDVDNFPVIQKVEVQPPGKEPLTQNTPEPGTILSAAVALGWGGWLKRKNSSQHNKTNS